MSPVPRRPAPPASRPPARFAAPAAPRADEREDRLAVALQRILQADEFPAFSRQIRELVASLDSDEHSAQRLANFVLRDYGLTLKVVRTANAAHYNRGGRPIRSVTHAMMLLGVGTVRSLALGMLLFEHYRARATSLKELLLLSLLSANHAREAAVRLQVDEPEAVHLAGMCRNIGEVLVACHFPAAYASIQRCASELLVQQAARGRGRRTAGASLDVSAAASTAAWRVLGFSFEDLGDALLAHWGMPADVRRCVHATGRAGETQLQALAAFGHELTTAVYRGDQALAESGVPVGAATVLEKYAPVLHLSRESLREVLAAAVAETRELFAEAGVSLDRLRVARQTAAALAELAEDEEAGGWRDESAPDESSTDAPADPEPALADARLAELRERLLADVDAAVALEAGPALHPVVLTILEALLRGVPADRALFCLVSADRQTLEARLGLGDDAERLVADCRLPLGRGATPAALALQRGQDVMLHDGPDATPDEARWVRALGARRVRLLPIVVDGTTVGALYGDTLADVGRSGDASAPDFMDRLRQAAVRAIALRRSAAGRYH